MATRKSNRTAQGGDFCSAINCLNARYKIDCKGLPFFNLPTKDGPRCRQWIQNMRRADLDKKSLLELAAAKIRVCGIHFEDKQFTVPSERKRLNWNAIPTIFNIPNPPPRINSKRPLTERPFIEPSPKRKCKASSEDPMDTMEDLEVQASAAARANSKPLRFKTVQNKLYRTQQRLKRTQAAIQRSNDILNVEEIMSQLSKFLPESTADFVRMQIRMSAKNKYGRRWDAKDKAMALSLYHASKKAYSLMCQLFTLPSISLLRKTVRDISIYPGFNQTVLSLLAQKVDNMPTNCKLCSIVFDEMSIKEKVSYNSERDEIEGLEDFGQHGRTKYVANHATVFLARGLLVNWKQPIGYFLSSGPINSNMLKTLIMDCVFHISCVGLEVKCVVADQGSNNMKAFKDLGVTEFQPYFLHNNKRVIVFYDPPHLLKNVRNNFKRTGFTTDKGQVEWRHVVNFFNTDKQNGVRMAPKLTEKHITLPPFSTLRVKYAAQVLSHSVAAGISFMARILQDENAAATAHFIENFDQIFNSFNSRNISSHKKMGHALTTNSGHSSFLHNMLIWLQTVETGSTRRLQCISGWRSDIRALLMLWDDMSMNHHVKFLLTERLNQDCVENLFSLIRGHASRVDNPSAVQFRSFLRNIMVDNLFHHVQGANCQEDQDIFLLNLKHFADRTRTERQTVVIPEVAACQTSKAFEIQFAPPSTHLLQAMESNVLTYIAGYMARALHSKLCPHCQELLKGKPTGSAKEVFLTIKQLEDTSVGLFTPSETLSSFVSHLESIYKRELPTMLHVSSVKSRLLAALHRQSPQTFLCKTGKCILQRKVINLFCNIRLHFTLKVCCESFQNKSQRRNRKVMKLNHI